VRILLVNQFISLEGGVERYLHDLCSNLTERNIQVVFLHGQSSDTEPPPNVKSLCLPDLWQQGQALSAKTRRNLFQVLTQENPDVVYLHNIEDGAAISLISSCHPTVRFIHGSKTTCPDGKRWLHRPDAQCFYPLSKTCMFRAHTRHCMPRLPTKAWRAFQQSRQSLVATQELPALIVASHFMKEMLALNHCSPERITVLPYFPQWEGEEWTPPMAPKSILFVGRLRTAKGILELIELLARTHSDITMSVVGDGLARQQAEETAQRLGLENRVTFHGWLMGGALKEAYQRNALVVVPSLWPEPFGIIGLEAATMCRPAIAFDVGGMGDWLKDSETGYLVKAGDFDQMQSRIESLLMNPEKARTMGLKARDYVEKHFCAESHLTELVRIFKSVQEHQPKSLS